MPYLEDLGDNRIMLADAMEVNLKRPGTENLLGMSHFIVANSAWAFTMLV